MKNSFMMVPEEVPAAGVVEWTCPSNIAIVKYWGKKPVQLPMNPSVSLTLSKALTKTTLQYEVMPENTEPEYRFTFEGRDVPEFSDRILRYLRSLAGTIPVLQHVRLHIDSSNTFPHSSGIASSASAFGALALCLASMEAAFKEARDPATYLRQASRLARLGSGSASRSLYGGFVLWGQTPVWEGSSDEYAIPVPHIHESFRGLRDSILIVEPGRKKVSSSAGHGIMESNPFAEARFEQARSNTGRLRTVLEEGNWPDFLQLMEEEALSLHAMMLTGRPGYLLMEPGTLRIINRIREYRADTGNHIGFTLDAGANVHVLFDPRHAAPVEAFLDAELLPFCHNRQVIHDRMGDGPANTRS